MAEEYHTQDRNPSLYCSEPQGVDNMAAIEEAVSTIVLADLLCGPAGNRSGLCPIGDKWVGRCPLADCASKSPSFAVWPGTDTWCCFGCLRGGDATDLARLAGDELAAKARGWRSP